MRRRPAPTTRVALLGIGVVVVAVAPSAHAAGPPPASTPPAACPAAGPIPAHELALGVDAAACDLVDRLVEAHGHSVHVPGPGSTTGMSALTEEGSVELSVSTSEDGIVTATSDFLEAPDDAASTGSTDTAEQFDVDAAAADPACSMGQYKVERRWSAAPGYYRNISGRPSNLAATDTNNAINLGASNIRNGYNNCGVSKAFTFGLASAGTTTRASNINGAVNGCASAGDGVNVVDFGNLVDSVIAFACWRLSGTSAGIPRPIETDIRFDNTSRSWVTSITGCTGTRYDLQAVATHEFGHMAGLGHVSEAGRGDLTMSPSTSTCDASARSLGWGDMGGLNYNY